MKWFWAWIILMTIKKKQSFKLDAQAEVWKNLMILQAHNAEEAVGKAFDLGYAQTGDTRGTLRLYGEPAVTRFIGVSDIGIIYDDLSDGAEILWQIKKCKQRTALSLATKRNTLISRLNKDLKLDQNRTSQP